MSTPCEPTSAVDRCILKYLNFMTKGDLSVAQDAGYLDENQAITPKGYGLHKVATNKTYPIEVPVVTSELDGLFK